jgi:hypothetical protein
LVSAVAASRLDDSTLQRLHLIVAGALTLGLISISRVVGVLFDYLMLWAWATTTLLLVAVGWTAALTLVRRSGTARSAEEVATTVAAPRARRHLALGPVGTTLVGGALVAALVGVVSSQVVKATGADSPGAGQSRVFADLVPSVVDRLEAGTIPGTGRDGRYLVGGFDPAFQHAGATGLLLALERHGLRVAFEEGFPLGFPRSRTMPGDEATAQLTVVSGEPAISEWRRSPDVVEIAYASARPSDEATFRRFRADLVRRLERAGSGDHLSIMDGSLLSVLVHPHTPDDVRDLVTVAVVGPSDLALPMAVFVEPLPSR